MEPFSGSSRFTRRTATVTIWVPESSRAFSMTWRSAYFPVPRMILDSSGRSPILRGLSVGTFYLISYHDLSILLTAVSVLIGLSIFLGKTKIGMAMRAVSQDKEACFLMGINVKVIYAIIVGISIALAGFSGAFLGHLYFVAPTMGDDLLVIAFTIVVLGGLGSIKGTIFASYIVGLVLAFSNLFVGVFYTPIVTFTIMLIMLAVRPKGLFGEG